MINNHDKEIEIIVNRFKNSDFEYVINKTTILLKKIPNNDLLWNLKGLSLQNLGNIKDSISCFQMSLNNNQKNIAARNNLGNSYKYANQLKLAEECFEECINIDPHYTASIVNLANLKTIVNDFDNAIKLYNKVLSNNKNIESIYVNLAQAYQSTRQFEKALQIISKGIQKYPNQTKLDKLLSVQTNYNENEIHLNQMLEKLSNQNLNEEQKINLYFSIGKAYEDKKEYSKSFDFYLKGNEQKRKRLKFNIEEKAKLFDDIKEFFLSRKDINQERKINEKNVIFIFGLPRSGTTLIENIISSHDEISAMGEINYLNKFFDINFVKKNRLDLNFINSFLNFDLQKMYFDFIKSFNIKTNIVTDKSLNVYWYLGFINMFFPNAMFIHCERDPKDNCLSIYKNLFEEGQGWKYNETELIEYVNLYREIMTFWNSILDDKILNIQYEDIIQDSENKIKEIIKFCKLEWDANCLNHHKNKIPIKTLSLNQANKPIYSSSVNSSKNYKPYLKELFSKFN